MITVELTFAEAHALMSFGDVLKLGGTAPSANLKSALEKIGAALERRQNEHKEDGKKAN